MGEQVNAANVDEAMEALRRFDNDSRVAGCVAARDPDMVLAVVEFLEGRKARRLAPPTCSTCGGFRSVQGDVEGVSMSLRCPDCDLAPITPETLDEMRRLHETNGRGML